MSRYRDLVRIARSKLEECVKGGAPDWLITYAAYSIDKADYFHARRRGPTCSVRQRAVNEILQLHDVLRHCLMSQQRR